MMISVVVPVYNVEKFLNQCITSILVQTYTDFELILVDDGSKDASGNICDEYSKKDSRVKVIHQVNGGVTQARCTGVREALGDYIYFVDADDTIVPDTLESIYARMNKDVDIVIYEGNIDAICTWVEFAKYLLNYQLLAVWGKLFRKELFDDYVFSIPRYFKIGEDFLMNLRLLKNIRNKVVISSERKYRYNTANPNSVQTASYRNYDYETKMVKEVISIIDDLPVVTPIRFNFIAWQLSYLSGMMGFQYAIDFKEPWIVKLKEEAKLYPTSMRNKIALKAIDYPILRYVFIFDKKLRKLAHHLIKR